MSPSFILQDGALLLGDAHYSHFRLQLLQLLEDIATKKLQVSQLILMGDIIDALFGGVTFTLHKNSKIIALIQEISQIVEVIYLEGNHDFNLHKIFPDAKVFTLKEQPVIADYRGEKVAFAHGDFDLGVGYKLYSSIIRNPLILQFLNFIDRKINNKIIKSIENYLSKKEDCNEFSLFKRYIFSRGLEKYRCRYFIEGHFHQDKSYVFEKFTYINLAAFACNERFFMVRYLQEKIVLEEKNSNKVCS